MPRAARQTASAPVDVAVVCVTHDASTVLPAFADSVRRASAGLSSRVLVVDSGSTDRSVDVAVDALPEADVGSLDGNAGFAAGINAGVRHVRATGGARTFVVANPDIVVDAGCLRALHRQVSQPGVGVAAPRLLDEHGQTARSLRRRPTLTMAWVEAVIGAGAAHRLGIPTEVVHDVLDRPTPFTGWATGGLLAISSDCLADVGPWAEDYFLYEEEVDYLLRVGDAGWQMVYVPDAIAVRAVGDDRVAPWVEALIRTNRLRHLRRRIGPVRHRIHRWAALAHTGLRSLAGRPEARAAWWAVARSAGPDEILARFRPGTIRRVRAQDDSAVPLRLVSESTHR